MQARWRAESGLHKDGDSHLRSIKAGTGYHIQATDGEIGHVENMLLDDHTWAIRYLVVDTSNWWGGHHVLVAPQWIQRVSWAEATVSVDVTRQAAKMPSVRFGGATRSAAGNGYRRTLWTPRLLEEQGEP